MGNDQSVPASRRAQNKLSKPKTNNNSGANLLYSKPAHDSHRELRVVNGEPVESSYSLLPQPPSFLEDVQPAAEVEPTRLERQKRRMSLFRSKSVQPESKKYTVGSEFERAVELPAEPSRWSRVMPRTRGNSVVFEPAHQTLGSSVELRPSCGPTHSRLSLMAQMPPPAPAQAEFISRYEQEETRPSLARTHSETQLYVPIRRRSLLQHGVATRAGALEESKYPPPPRARDEEESPNHQNPPPATTTLAPSATLAVLQRPRDLSPSPRVETPNELDYGHIGAFKLGTLRIMNGAASPSPSQEPPRRAATMGYEDHYFGAGGRSDVEWRSGLGPRSNSISLSAESRPTSWNARAESPLRQDAAAAALGGHRPQTLTRAPARSELQCELESPPPPPAKLAFPALTIDIPDPELSTLALFDFTTEETRARSTKPPPTSLDLAAEYRRDLDLARSPFSFDESPLASPRLPVLSKSKHMAAEDELFDEAEPQTPLTSARPTRSFDSGYGSSSLTKTVPGPREAPVKSLAKADSGYSSNVSVRSFKRDPAAREPPPTPPKDTFRERHRGRAASTVDPGTSRAAPRGYPDSAGPAATCSAHSARNYSVPSPESGPNLRLRVRKSLPALPVEAKLESCTPRHLARVTWISDSAPQKPNLTSLPSPLASHPVVLVQSQIQSPVSRKFESQCQFTCPAQPPPKPRSKSRPQSQDQGKSPLSPQITRKESSSASVLAPSCRRTAINTNASKEAPRRPEQRVDTSPVAHTPSTDAGRLGLRHSCSKETLGTIFSVGSLEVRDELSYARLQRPLPPIPQEAIHELPATTPLHELPALPIHRYSASRSAEKQLRERPASPIYSYTAPWADVNRRNSLQAQAPLNLARYEPPSRQSNESFNSAAVQAQPELERQRASFSSTCHSPGKEMYTAARSTPARHGEPKMPDTYESIANGNPYRDQQREPEVRIERPRERIRSYPPQAHARFSMGATSPRSDPAALPFRRDSDQYVSDDEQQRLSALPSPLKQKNLPPPVSMTTQRTVVWPTAGLASSAQGLVRSDQQQAANYQPGRRQSAGEALQVHGRKTIETRRSSKPELRCRGSVDAHFYGQAAEAMGTSHRNFEAGQGRSGQAWNVGVGYEEHAIGALPTWVDATIRSPTFYQHQQHRPTQGYNHNFGSSARSYN
ncbi:unnamed protein product [Diplocarpon coronariae]